MKFCLPIGFQSALPYGRIHLAMAVMVHMGLPVLSFAADGKALLEPVRKAAQAEAQTAAAATEARKVELVAKYVAALTALEKSLAPSGRLDAILHVREEREAVEQTGSPTVHNDTELLELRSKYLKSLGLITAGLKSARERLVAATSLKIKEQETLLTKAGKVDDAIAVRKEGQRLLLELSEGDGAGKQLFEEDPRIAESPAVKPLQKIEIPTEKPIENPFGNPFAEEGRWLESQTIPTAKQKIRRPILIGDRGFKKWPLIVVAPGSVWAGADKGRLELSACKFVADKCRFESLELGCDHACFYFFQNSAFVDCDFKRIGIWYGGDQAARWYMENCYIRGKFSDKLTVVDVGLRLHTSVFEDIKFPSMQYLKKQPAYYVNHGWMRIANCRFVDCEIPLSFLLLTRDCIFENCVFVNDGANSGDVPVVEAFETVIYTANCKSRLTKVPSVIKVIDKPVPEYMGVAIPTLASLSTLFPK